MKQYTGKTNRSLNNDDENERDQAVVIKSDA